MKNPRIHTAGSESSDSMGSSGTCVGCFPAVLPLPAPVTPTAKQTPGPRNRECTAGQELQGAQGHPAPQGLSSAHVAAAQGLQLAGGRTRGQHRGCSFLTIITIISVSGLLARGQLQSLFALALALGALCWLPPVPVVAVADVAVVHLHLDARGDDGGARKAVRTCGNTWGEMG